MRLLILGGTTEATALCAAIAVRPDIAPTLSLAGRTARPVLPDIPCRIGGFGGVEGLAAYLEREAVEAVVDATHPFAARISAHAVAACARRHVPLMAFTRPAWRPAPGHRWVAVPDLDAAADALGTASRRVLLTVGRLGLAAFLPAPQHHYIVRTIDPPDAADLPPDHRLVLARGPFGLADERALMLRERIDVLVTKNSGGHGAAAKLDAARDLGVTVIAVDRPAIGGGRHELCALDEVLGWIEAHRGRPSGGGPSGPVSPP